MPQAVLPLARDVAKGLHTTHFGRAMRSYSEVSSTNSLARAWADEGAPEGSLVLAEYQREGRGRLGRSWAATQGSNLLFSLVLRPPLAPEAWGRIGMAAALAVAQTIRPIAPALPVRVRWPNDVLLDGRKCSGMLLEASYPVSAGEAPWPSHVSHPALILGIGLNVNERRLPEHLSESATSLLLSSGRLHDRASLLTRLLGYLEHSYSIALDESNDSLVAMYEDCLEGIGSDITLYPAMPSSRPAVRGIMLGVEPNGGLKVQTEEGLRIYYSGDVTSHPGTARS